MRSGTGTIRPFDPGVGVHFVRDSFRFDYDADSFGPGNPELRRLDDIRSGLADRSCTGPDPVYAIAMDVGRVAQAEELKKRHLLYGVVAYAAGRLGKEPVRSQGHVHAISPHSGWSTPELVEIWSGRAIVYLQKFVADDPGPCVAVVANVGEVVLIPPGWAHCIMNADPKREMVFGAFCDRQYGFVYDDIRKRGGVAWFAELKSDSSIEWHANPAYSGTEITVRAAREYPELGIDSKFSIYSQFVRNPENLQWVSEPAIHAGLWESFLP